MKKLLLTTLLLFAISGLMTACNGSNNISENNTVCEDGAFRCFEYDAQLVQKCINNDWRDWDRCADDAQCVEDQNSTIHPACEKETSPECGDGSVDDDEECDDGNTITEECDYGDASCTVCDSSCKSVTGATSFCGDDTINGDEGCDDGNAITETCNYGDNCTVCDSSCNLVSGVATFCGDGIKNGIEQCDDGNTVTETCNYGDASCTVCDSSCNSVAGATSFCGDGATNGSEQCDDGNITTEECNYGDTNCTVCDASCSSVAGATSFCGDGTTNGAEQCDDGNSVTLDGCENDCSLSYLVIPTHQTKCYNDSVEITCPTTSQDFYGQDAQYPEATRIYTVQGTAPEKTVVDSMTTLEWQQTIDEMANRNWTDAGNYCTNLDYGGQTDWRLPTIQELSTLPHYGKNSPAIDDTAFPSTPSSFSWSSTTVSSDNSFAFGMGFSTGYVSSTGKINTYNVRCVRGTYNNHSAFTVSTVFDDVIVTDSKTNLIWQQTFVTGKIWKEALAYCTSLNYAGKTNWRLPDINELKTIVDYTKTNPSIDETAFPDRPSNSFWSSTTNNFDINNGWCMHFSHGSVRSNFKMNSSGKDDDFYVTCVSTAGAATFCGDGTINGIEQCDDGNTVTETCNYGNTSCTVCDSSCNSVAGATSFCGDDTVNGDEECDDGNSVNLDGCENDCSLSYLVIPTHQTKCYNDTTEITCPTTSQDFYGQDAQYPEATRIFTVQGSEPEQTIIDSMTTLEWQQTISATTRTWDTASSYCSGLNYGGHTDWRLPAIQELSTLPHYGKNTPAIDETAFPSAPSSVFWSLTTFSHSPDDAWGVNFDRGNVFNYDKTYLYDVRCVRGNYDSTASFIVSTVSGDAIVTDSTTNLVWQQTYFYAKQWKEALAYCEGLNYADKTDWRLPDVNELYTIVDYTQYDPAIDETVFPSTDSYFFWSSTTLGTDHAWTVDFFRGGLNGSDNKSLTRHGRCVR